MTARRASLRRAAAFGLLVCGAALLAGAEAARRTSSADLREASYVAVSRTRALDAFGAAPNEDRDVVSALIFPNLPACRALCGEEGQTLPVAGVLAHDCVRQAFRTVLAGLAARSTGSSTFVARAVLLDEPPSIDAREITDKGSLNQKAVLLHRSAIVDEIYESKAGPRVIVANER